MKPRKTDIINEGYVFFRREWYEVTNAWSNYNVDQKTGERQDTRTLSLKPLFGQYASNSVVFHPESKLFWRDTKPENEMDKYSD